MSAHGADADYLEALALRLADAAVLPLELARQCVADVAVSARGPRRGALAQELEAGIHPQ
jgi:hypothetical protein